MVFLDIFGLDFRLIDFIKLSYRFFVILTGKIESSQIIASLGNGGMHGIAIDECLQQITGIQIVELSRTHTLIEQRVGFQIMLFVIGAFIDIFKILLRRSVLLLIEQIHRSLVFILR